MEQIFALKFPGLPLKQIRSLLDGGAVRLNDALAMQRRLLQTRRVMLGRAIQAIREAEQHITKRGAATAAEKVIEVIEMGKHDWTGKSTCGRRNCRST